MSVDFNLICRSCMGNANRMQCIFQAEDGEPFSTSELLSSITTIQAHQDDGLPNQMCSVCLFELQQATAFKRKAEQSDFELKQYLHNFEVKNECGPPLLIKMELDPYTSTIKFVDENEASPPPSPVPDMADDMTDGDYEPEYLLDNFEEKHSSGNSATAEIKTEQDEPSVPVKKRGRPKKTDSDVKPTLKKPAKKIVGNPAVVYTGRMLFQCGACKTDFVDQTSIRKHNLKCVLRASDPKPKVNCGNCGTAFKQVTTLNRHLQVEACLKPKVKVPRKHSKYDCAHCPVGYRHRDKFVRHLMVHGFQPLLPCQHCDEELPSSEELREHVRLQHTMREHLCQICGKAFSVKNTLRLHMLRHDPEKAYKCTLCPFGCITRNEMENHMTKHTGEHPFKCRVCDHRSTTRSARARHMRIHTGEKKHACEFCPMRFAVPYTLKNHRRTHTGEKPYACDQCDRTFTQRYDCISHQKTHIVGYKFRCKHCPQTFDRHSSLKTHTKSHSNKAFKQEHAIAIGSILTLSEAVQFTK